MNNHERKLREVEYKLREKHHLYLCVCMCIILSILFPILTACSYLTKTNKECMSKRDLSQENAFEETEGEVRTCYKRHRLGTQIHKIKIKFKLYQQHHTSLLH